MGIGKEKTATVTVTDSDAEDTHTVAASSSKTSVATVSVSGKTLTIAGKAAGRATIRYSATDSSKAPNAESTERTFTVTVANSRPIVAAISDRSVAEDGTAQATVSVTDRDADDTHTITASSSNTRTVRVTVAGKTLTIRGIRAGRATVRVTADDGSGASNAVSAVVEFDVTVISGTLVVSVSPQVNAGDYTVSWPAVTAAEEYTVHEEHDGKTTSYDRTTTTNSKTFSGKAAGLYTYTVDFCQFGVCSPTGYGASSARVNSRPTVGAVAAQRVAAGDDVDVSVAVTDVDDADTPVLRASTRDADTATVTVSGTTLTVTGVNRGATEVEYWATDGTRASNQESTRRSFAVTVPNSQPRVGTITDASVGVGATATRTVPVSDADPRDTHTVAATTSDEDVATVAVSGETLTVTGIGAGNATITVTARDNSQAGNALSAERTFEVTVGASNSRPVVAAIRDMRVAEGSAVTLSVVVSDDDVADTHTVSASSSREATARVGVAGKVLTITGVRPGTATITVTAEDSSGADNDTSAPVEFDVTVISGTLVVTVSPQVNAGTYTVSWPAVTAAESYTVEEKHDGTPRSYETGTSTTSMEFSDKAVGVYSYTVEYCQFGGCFETGYGAGSGRVNSQPTVGGVSPQTVAAGNDVDVSVEVADADDVDSPVLRASTKDRETATVTVSGTTLTVAGVNRGATEVEYWATDRTRASNQESTKRSFPVTVPNSQPRVGTITDASIGVGAMATRTVPVSDADPRDTHTVSAATSDEDVATIKVSGKTLTVTGIGAGSATITITARDDSRAGNALSEERTFEVTVAASNSRPVVAAISDWRVGEGSTVTVPVVVSDDDVADTHTVSALPSLDAARVDVDGKLLRITGVRAGTATIKVTAQDSSGADNDTSAPVEFDVTVISGPLVVTVSPQANAGDYTVSWPEVTAAERYTVEEHYGDSITEHETGTNTNSMKFSGKPAGLYSYTVEYCQFGGCFDTGYGAGSGRVNSQPVVDPITGRSVPAGGSVSVPVTVSDPDPDNPVDSLVISAASEDETIATVSVRGRTLTVHGLASGSTMVEVTASDRTRAPNQVSEPVAFDVTVIGGAVAVTPSVSAGEHTVSWPAYRGAASYRLHEMRGTSRMSYDVAGTSKLLAGKSPGTYEYTVDRCASSETCTATGYAAATVRVNAQPAVAAIAAQSVQVDSSADAEVVVTDADTSDKHGVDAQSSDPAVATVSVNDKTMTITGVSAGVATITYSAVDDSGASNARSAEGTFVVDVAVGNRQPTVAAFGDQRVQAGSTQTVEVTVSDPDAEDTHTLAAASSDVAVATVEVKNGNTLSIFGAAVGTATVTVTARDSSGAANAESEPVRATVTVVPPEGAVAVAPVVSGGDYVVSWPEVAGAATYTLREVKGDESETYAGLAATNRQFTDRSAGTYVYTVDSCAADNTCAATGFTAGSVRVNSPPAVETVTRQSVAVGVDVEVPVRVTDSDDPAENLFVEAEVLDESVATIKTAGTTITVTGVAKGTTTVEYRANDGSKASNARSPVATFEVEVTVSNSQPIVAALTDQTLDVGESTTLTVEVTDADAEDEHTAGAESDNTGVVTVSASGTTLTLEAVAAGSATVTYWATDNSDASNDKSEEHEFTVVVTAGECPGTIAGAITGPTTSSDGAFTLAWTGDHCLAMHDADGFWHFSNPSGSNSSKSFAGLPSGEYRFKLYSCTLLDTPGIDTWDCSYSARAHTVVVTRDAETALATTYAAGTTAYTAGVGNDGSVRVSVPIQTLPGVHGLSLPVMLDYSSTRHTDITDIHFVDDHVGHGWRLAGIPKLHRCRAGVGGSLALDATDRLCLDGTALVAIAGTYWTPGAEYRTEIQTHIKLVQRGTAAEPWFEAQWPDGRTGSFGKTGSRVRAGQRRSGDTCGDGSGAGLWCPEETPHLLWGLDAMTHPLGNTLAVSYETHEPNGVLNPKAIRYSNAEVRFRYGPRGDLPARAVGSPVVSKVKRHSVLHTIDVSFRGRAVRQYRLDSNLSGGNLRLEKIQECGYTQNGTLEACLAPLEFSWTTVPGAPSGFTVAVSGITDGLGADTSFGYRALGTNHSFGYTERPFGTMFAAADVEGISQVVATTLERDDGRHGTRGFEYRYRGAPQRSTKGRGYVGFHAVRQRDVAGGSYTYRQIRMDWPFFGGVARTRTLSGTSGSDSAEILSRFDVAYASLSMHGGTVRYPYTARTTRWNYLEGGVVGATKTVSTYTQSGEFVTRRQTTASTGTTVTVGPHTPAVWGDVPDRPLDGVLRTVTTTDEFANTTSDWTIGKLIRRSVAYAAPRQKTKTVDATFSYKPGTRIVSSETRLPNHATLTLTTARTFTGAGHVYTERVSGDDVAARTTAFGSYTESRYPSSVTNPLGQRTSFGYDLRYGVPNSITDPDSRVATLEYDAFGRVVRSTATDGTVATITYARCTACPNSSASEEAVVVTTTVSNGSTQVAPTQRVYLDVLGREVLTEVEALDSKQGWRRQFRNYDPQGRLKDVSRPYFSTEAAFACSHPRDEGADLEGPSDCTVHNYGSADDTVESSIVRPDGGEMRTVRSAVVGTATVDTTVVILGGTTDEEHRTKRTKFNALGEVVETVDAHGTDDAVKTTYGYDAQGYLARVTVADVVVAEMIYDELGNRTEIRDRSLGTWHSQYTALSQLDRRVEGANPPTRYRYDVLGRMTGRDECTSSSCARPSTSTWTYDPPNATGRLASRTGGGLAQTYTYRADGKPERVDTRIDVPGVLTASYAQTLGYDGAGRMSSVGHDGTTFTRTYNPRGYLHQVRHGTTVLHEFRATDAFGSSTEERLGGGAVHATRSYDPGTGRLASITTGKATTPRSIQDLEYRWRTDGSLHQRIDRRGTMDPAHHLTDTFTMDALARVVQQATTGAAVRQRNYTYDAFGNLKSKPDGDLNFVHTVATGKKGPYRLTKVEADSGTTSIRYNRANMALYLGEHARTVVKYDDANRVTRIAVSSSDSAADDFWYGPDGSRFLRRETWTESDEVRSRLTVYLGTLEEARPSHGAHAKVRRIRATGSAVRIERTARDTSVVDARFEYLHRDHLGSVDRVTDAAGNPAGSVPSVSFDPFGSHRKADRSADLDAADRAALRGVEDERSSRGFTDHEHLSRTGMVHMNGRVYDPRLGRFLSPDPIVANPYHSQSWNRYAYVQNRPLSFTDPTGLYMSGSYYGLTADDFNVVDWNRMLTLELWDWVGDVGRPTAAGLSLRLPFGQSGGGFCKCLGGSLAGPMAAGATVGPATEPTAPPVEFTAQQVTYARMAWYAYRLTAADVGSFTLDGYDLVASPANRTGLDLLLFRSETQLVVVAAGTNQLRDWLHNGSQAMGLGSSQYTAAMEYAQKLREDNPGVSLHFVGHSLGGGLAPAMAAATGLYGDYTVFNAAGLHPRTVGREAFDRLHGTHFYSSMDVLQPVNALLGTPVPGTQISLGKAGFHGMTGVCWGMRCF